MDEHSRLINRLLDDVRSLASDIKDVSVSTARHDEILKDRSQIITRTEERLTLMEAEHKEIVRRTNEHGRRTDGIERTVLALSRAQKEAEKHVALPPSDWKNNLPLISLLAITAIAAIVLFLSFGGDPGDLVDVIP